MRNVTISVPDEVYHRMQLRAAELEVSLSALLRAQLLHFDVSAGRDFERGKRLQEETFRAIGIFHGANRLSRDEVHNR